MEIMRRAVAEIVEVLMVEIRQLQRHPEIGGLNSGIFLFSVLFSAAQPRRMTIDEAVDGLAQPRLALTSTFLTWRQPPSR